MMARGTGRSKRNYHDRLLGRLAYANRSGPVDGGEIIHRTFAARDIGINTVLELRVGKDELLARLTSAPAPLTP